MVSEGLIEYSSDTRPTTWDRCWRRRGGGHQDHPGRRGTAVHGAAGRADRAGGAPAISPMPDGHFTAIAKIESRKDIKITIEIGSRFDLGRATAQPADGRVA